jgi:hypothetical protein
MKTIQISILLVWVGFYLYDWQTALSVNIVTMSLFTAVNPVSRRRLIRGVKAFPILLKNVCRKLILKRRVTQ